MAQQSRPRLGYSWNSLDARGTSPTLQAMTLSLFTSLRRAVFATLNPATSLWALALLLVVRPQADPDYWWHLRVGEWISAHGAVPHTALFSWLAAGHTWVAHEWLDEVLLYQLHLRFDVYGSIVMFAALNAAVLFGVERILHLLRPSLSTTARAALVLLTALVALPVWSPRGQMWDIAFGLLTAYVLLAYLEQGRRRPLWLLGPMMLVWVNLHGGGVLVFGLITAAILAGEALNRRLGWSLRRPWQPLLVPLGLALLAAAASPAGPLIYLYPFGTVASSAMQDLIVEWHSPDFHELTFRFAQGFLALGLIGLLAFIRVRDARAIVLGAGLTLMFLQAARYVGLFAPLSVALLGPWLALAAAHLVRLAPPVHSPLRAGSRRLLGAVFAASFSVMLVVWFIKMPTLQAQAVAEQQPVAAVEWLASHPQAGRLWNDYNFGGYLIWHLPQTPVGYYGAADAFGDAGLKALSDLLRGASDPGLYLRQQHVDWVLTAADRPLAQWLSVSPDWERLYADASAVVYRLRS